MSSSSLTGMQKLTLCTERMMRKWTTPIYAFYHPVPAAGYIKDKKGKERPAHTFKCYNRGCTQTINRYLDTMDRSSTGNLLRHAKSCWGDEAVDIAQSQHETAKSARESVTTPLKRNGDIKLAFERKGKGKITYSTRPHTKTEAR